MTETCEAKGSGGRCKRAPFFHGLCKQHLKMHLAELEDHAAFDEKTRRREDELNSVVIKALSEYGARLDEIAGRVHRISRERVRLLMAVASGKI